MLDKLSQTLSKVPTIFYEGHLKEVKVSTLWGDIPHPQIGNIVEILPTHEANAEPLLAEITGFSSQGTRFAPYAKTRGLTRGAKIRKFSKHAQLEVGPHLLGSLLDGLGRPLQSPTYTDREFSHLPRRTLYLDNDPPPPLSRPIIDQPFITGIRAIDGFTTLGVGQRICLFAEPGVGKSTLISMIARGSMADINVIGLIGERGREVREFLEDSLDEATRSRTIVVASTSDEPPIMRAAAALTATTICEYFRDLGYNVLLEVDSLTRLLRAWREVGLDAGEVPVRRGYPASVLGKLPRIVERTGTSENGSITAIYTALLSGDLEEDPMVEEIKGITDGHLIMKTSLAEQGHFPAIDVPSSLSRLQSRLLNKNALAQISKLRCYLSRLAKDKEILALGGTPDQELKEALALEQDLETFTRQTREQYSSLEECLESIRALCEPKV